MSNMTFEESLKKLELIVRELESGEIDLDKSMEKYKEATKLVEECNKKLTEANETINKIINKNGTEEEFKLESKEEVA